MQSVMDRYPMKSAQVKRINSNEAMNHNYDHIYNSKEHKQEKRNAIPLEAESSSYQASPSLPSRAGPQQAEPSSLLSLHMGSVSTWRSSSSAGSSSATGASQSCQSA